MSRHRCGVFPKRFFFVAILSGLVVVGVQAQSLSGNQSADLLRPADHRPFQDFVKVWDSGESLAGVPCLAAGDVDNDGRLDFVGNRYESGAGGILVMFESDGNGGYEEVWNSRGAERIGSGAYTAATYGDIDGDGNLEIVAGGIPGTITAFGKSAGSEDYELILDSYLPGTGSEVTSIHVADTNGNGRNEIVRTASTPSGYFYRSTIFILEYVGDGEDHRLAKILGEEIYPSIWGAAVGDIDHDNCADIVLYGNATGMLIWRLEFDPGMANWEESRFEFSPDGRLAFPVITDIDSDGKDDLFYSTRNPGGIVLIGSKSDNSFYIRSQTNEIPGVERAGRLSVMLPSRFSHRRAYIAADIGLGQVKLWSLNRSLKKFKLLDTIEYEGAGFRQLEIINRDFGMGVEMIGARDNNIVVYRKERADAVAAVPAIMSERAIAVVPNPFNPATTVSFSTDKSQRVRVAVYDIRGHQVVEVVDQHFSEGEHSVQWQGCDSVGCAVPSGQYFFRVESGGEVQIKKALLLK